jgi:hypothetical protein
VLAIQPIGAVLIFLGSRLERREDGLRVRAGAVSKRDGGQAVTGGARGSA